MTLISDIRDIHPSMLCTEQMWGKKWKLLVVIAKKSVTINVVQI